MRIFSILFTAVATLILAGCSSDRIFDLLNTEKTLIVLTRNSPTTYYFDNDEETGFEYELTKAFADAEGLKLRISVAFTLDDLMKSLAQGEAHVAAAGLTKTIDRDNQFKATIPYLRQKPLVVYKSGASRPRDLSQLANRDIVVLAGSSHIESLKILNRTVGNISWREIHAADSLEIMQLVAEEKAELAIVDSIEFRMQQGLFPRLVAALSLEDEEDIVWYLPPLPGSDELLTRFNRFLDGYRDSGALQRLQERHFGSTKNASRIGSFTFQRNVQTTLPKWQPLIEAVAHEYQLDWRLLAAVAYQESHWNPKAVSPTGVRGMMMITHATAKDLGVTKRTDANQSLRGGARFMNSLSRRLPSDIAEPDRTWMALAAYNVGMGHLEDARVLAQKAGHNPDHWEDVRAHLPKLQNPDYYPSTRFGFARGQEAVTYVDNIRHYYSVLKLQEVPSNLLTPPIATTQLLPEAWQQAVPTAL
mgnify:CR=1 FL=1|tara:strand:- start:191 stop:1615 length:1425 start_codon:yes stop_codon:yes gene_type:complete